MIDKNTIRKHLETFKTYRLPQGATVALILSLGLIGIVSIVNLEAHAKPSGPDKNTVRIELHQPIEPQPTQYDLNQLQCLADNAYYEAGNQTIRGKIAVTNVVMNRVNDRRFPSTPCAVIYQRSRGVCQFSWVCENKSRRKNPQVYQRAVEAAEDVYYRGEPDVTYGAKYYHADYVRPYWSRVFERTVIIGNHIFYRD